MKLKDNYREENKLIKYASVGKRYYFSYNSPGWPSKSFNRYIKHQLSRFDTNTSVTLHTLVFGITKKCGFKCEHCFEWSNLNQPETLSKEDVTKILRNFSDHGVSMVQITGGEPLNRFNEIIEMLPLFSGIDFWIYTSGYHLTDGKARLLKKTGLTGVTISLDHWIPELHDAFRGKQGSFKWVEKAANNITANKLALCLAICATNNFISEDNLYQYLELAKKLNASFVQILEPKAVGHYAGKDVMLSTSNIEILDVFYKNVNFNSKYLDYPSVVYHGFYSRRLGCSGAGKDYLYVDMDGWVHDCPFCQKKIFNALTGEITKQVEAMRTFGC
ncbi:MAG: radical SAM protein, partial [Segetibacter sp.]